jgi:hypothetical protein
MPKKKKLGDLWDVGQTARRGEIDNNYASRYLLALCKHRANQSTQSNQ